MFLIHVLKVLDFKSMFDSVGVCRRGDFFGGGSVYGTWAATDFFVLYNVCSVFVACSDERRSHGMFVSNCHFVRA